MGASQGDARIAVLIGGTVKRHKSLVPLTVDHHHGLVQAHRLIKAAELPAAEASAAAQAFVAFAKEHLVAHFGAEEEHLLPALCAHVDPAKDEQCVRMMAEHEAFWRRLSAVEQALAKGPPPPELMIALGQSLDDHIRFEEREFFPRIESLLTKQEIERLGDLLHREEG
jgi:hemerythrin-like domain-containing protein